jgi:hypothetical protein
MGMDHRTKVSIRDFAIFQLKLLIDGLKDGTVFTVSFVAFAVDLIFKRHGERRYAELFTLQAAGYR